ncbi:uncharacterized protein LOC106876149 isoform X3 [Octopus bimaculoides]|uniref:uncharacterized protein LOC106876149 isoform X3 n=1 Tax=Octopus bimaculoides TaxID=37653 RepID=UPI00071E391C|nr:uncharacterized protein LOC106876149 isoform X3 [Octopus bimaculoides]|eukprot:XP_014780078.1 PREDICTED: uncharacterized protein LOC106876149 isoform X2 [Octopus bimaculoides]
MATLTKHEQKQSLQQAAIRQKKKAVKSVLITPFKTQWPKIPVEDQQKILDDLTSILLPVYHEKKEMNQKSKQTDMKNIAKRKAMQNQLMVNVSSRISFLQ